MQPSLPALSSAVPQSFAADFRAPALAALLALVTVAVLTMSTPWT
jgi:hypothetical protein